jgi:hypothetical protein
MQEFAPVRLILNAKRVIASSRSSFGSGGSRKHAPTLHTGRCKAPTSSAAFKRPAVTIMQNRFLVWADERAFDRKVSLTCCADELTRHVK